MAGEKMTEKVNYEKFEKKIKSLKNRIRELELNQGSLKESEKRYRTLLDFAPYPVATFTLKGEISYLNPAFTEVFGWTLEEMKSGIASFVPPGLAPETSEKLRELFKERIVTRYVTKRLSKDGRILDVIARGAVFSKSEMGLAGELVIFRDITKETRTAKSNETMLRISMALPQYPDLEDLLDYVSNEIKRLLDTQGALVILLDEETKELFFPGAADDDKITKRKLKEIRVHMDSMASGKVIRTGRPVIVNDRTEASGLYPLRDEKFGYTFDNYVLVPIYSSDRIIGVLAAFNKIQGIFEQSDMQLLEMVAGNVGLSIENARFSDELKLSYKELASLDRAKTKAINHLSHELKTPVSVFSGTLNILAKKLRQLPDDTWKSSIARAQRNVERIKRLQNEINDIILEKDGGTNEFILYLVEQCTDLLESVLEEKAGDTPVIESIRKRINNIFDIKETEPEAIQLDKFVSQCIEGLKPEFSHRNLNIDKNLKSTPEIFIPVVPLKKVIKGLIKNAIENTPDQGRIEITVSKAESGVKFAVKDFGVGIKKNQQQKIFEGFFTTQETSAYSSKEPFDFNAGGRGGDLLRMKIFSKRYDFDIGITSSKCRFLLEKDDICPGKIEACSFCRDHNDCYQSGGSEFSIMFKTR
jgi:PAS domain S-box-containing protein